MGLSSAPIVTKDSASKAPIRAPANKHDKPMSWRWSLLDHELLSGAPIISVH